MENYQKSLNRIFSKVEDGLKENHNKIVLNVFQHLLNKHNDYPNCKCEYCSQIEYYVSLKKRFHRMKKDYDHEWNIRIYNQEDLDYMKRTIKIFKKNKDKLKSLG